MLLTPNRSKILNFFILKQTINGKFSKKAFHITELVKDLNIPKTTIIDNLAVLVSEGVIKKLRQKVNDKRGRPITLWSMI